MQVTFEPARLTGLAILAVAGATALSVGACSSSHNEKSPSTSSPAAAPGKDAVHGLIASVSGNAVQVTETTGTATVDVSPSTKVTDDTKAQLTDIAAGNCVSVVAKPGSAPVGAVTANSVQLTPQGGDGKCPQPKNAQPPKVIGTVASVAGNTINVTVIDANGAIHKARLCNFAGHRARQVHHRTRKKGWWRDAAGDGYRLGPHLRRPMPAACR
jgi:hypothetical protein